VTIDRLLREAAARGITLRADGEHLRVTAPKGALTADMKDALAAHKQELLAHLAGAIGADSGAHIPVVGRDRPLPLSFAQQRLWVLDQLEGGRAIYHVPACAWLDGALNVAALQQAFASTCARHEALRTTFPSENGEPLQCIRAEAGRFDVEDVSASNDAEATALEKATALARIPFDLSEGPLIRARLFRTRHDRHLFSLTFHHIIADAWSMRVLMRDLSAYYEAAVSGVAAQLPPLAIQYADFAAWQRDRLHGAQLQELLTYWRGALDGIEPIIDLPLDRPRPAVQSFAGELARFTVDAARVSKFRAIAEQRGATLFQALLAAFQLLLHRYSGQSSIVVGSPIANRLHTDLEPLIGFFVNTIALRAELEPELTFADLLDRVRSTTVAAYEYQELPFELLVSELAPARTLSHSPIFQVMFALQNARSPQTRIGDIAVTPGTAELGAAKFDWYLSLEERADGSLAGEWEYATDLFDAATVQRAIGHFLALLDAIADQPQARIAQLSLMDRAEETRLTREWNRDPLPWPSDTTLDELVSAQALRTPHAIAVDDGVARISYQELDRRSNQLAHDLRAAGAAAGTLVGLAVERSANAIVALIGILKAGSAYVPLDPNYPKDRIAFMAEDAALRYFVAQESTRRELPATATIVSIDGDRSRIDSRPISALDGPASNAPAYVIYTSGSTGRPKGIQIEHRNAVSMLTWAASAFASEDVRGMLASTSFCFDLSIFEIFLPLMTGGTAIVAENAPALGRHASRDRVTMINTVPSAIAELVREGGVPDSVVVINLAGEPLSRSLVDRIYESTAVRDVFDLYGPGETTTYSTYGRREPGGRESIGRPIANTALYILDGERRPVPIGVSGEIYIGGPGVARGYLNRDALTAERFVADPFNGGRMYRTGDLGRYWPDGCIQYLGRADQQIKLRGFRIELGEVEHAMLGLEGVREAVAVVRNDDRLSPRLLAYFTGSATSTELRQHVATQLPTYMVPSALVQLDAMPLTPNGKIDRRALPAVDSHRDERDIVRASTEREAALCALWSEVLRVDRVGVTDNFFEIGGDSILAIQIAGRAQARGLAFAASSVFQHQTVRELAAIATDVSGESHADEESGDVELSAIQRWGLAADSPQPQHFNQWIAIEVPAALPASTLRDAVASVAAQHGAFRLRFERADAGWRQWYAETPGLTLSEATLASPDQFDEAAAAIHRSLDLARGPIARAVLFRSAGRASRLLITIHHLVVDGVSWRILCDDVLAACGAIERGLPPPLATRTASYQRWSAASANDLAGETVDDRFGVHGETRSIGGAISTAATVRLMRESAAAYGARIDETLCAAVAAALSSWDGASTHSFDVESHGRDHLGGIDVSRTIGWFTHFAPVTLMRRGEDDWAELLAAAKIACRHAKSGRFAPGHAISFNYLGQIDLALPPESGWTLAATGLSVDPDRPRRHAIDITMSVRDGRLCWTIESVDRLHAADDIERLSRAFAEQITRLADHCSDPAAGSYSPADFPDVVLTQPELDAMRAAAPRLHRNIESILPISDAQHGILFHSLLAGGTDIYLTQLRCELNGSVDAAAFADAWRRVIARHGALRTAFVRDTQQHWLQITLKDAAFELVDEDWRGMPSAHASERAHSDRRAFDLAAAPLMRVTLARTGERSWQFIWTSHHAILDGWSLAVVLRDLAASYGTTAPGWPPLLPYRHYALEAMRAGDSSSEAFWRSELEGWCEATDPGFIQPAAPAGARESAKLVLPEDATRRIQQFARKNHLTLHTVLQAAWAVTLSRYSDREDVMFGGVVSGRAGNTASGGDRAAGLFIRTLPVRIRVSDDLPVDAWLSALQSRQTEREVHAHVPLVTIREMAPLPRGADLFDTLLVLENYPIDEALQQRLGDLEVGSVEVFERPHYPLTITISAGSQLAINAVYDGGRVDAAAITPLLERFAAVMRQLASETAGSVVDLSVMTAEEERRVLVDWNATERAYETDVTLIDLFERQVRRSPDAVAVVFGDRSLTYAQLEARANQVGHALRSAGAGRNTLVGVCLERSLEMVIALYGILKAGAAYVPIDPSYPPERRELMISDSGVSMVLDRARIAAIRGATTPPMREVKAADLAYMIYTSGSTGTPKGALNSHAAIVNRLLWMQEAFAIGEDDRVLQKTPFSFDVSVWEFFWPLITGAQLVVAEPGGHLDPAYLAATIEQHRITTLHFVPSMLQVFVESRNLSRARGLRRVITSGEALTPDHVTAFHAAFPNTELHNLYGPTEAAVDVTWWPCPRDPNIAVVPIGKPIANTRMYVLDRKGRAVPAGVAGELYIGGVQVGLGYWGRPELTAERFLRDPFSDVAGARMYRTGDRARFMPDGAIEYLGRIDQQVKIRGVRIELGEIEAVLRTHASVRDAVALVRMQRGDAQLIAYVVAGEIPVDTVALRAYLRTRLPEVMVPAFIAMIESIPLSPNGKLDRRALPDPSDAPVPAAEPGPPTMSSIERTIADAWTSVLGHTAFASTDNFFDVGGHSLSAMRVHGILQRAFGSAVTLLTLFEHPTVRALARHISGAAPMPVAPVKRRRPQEGAYDIAVIGMACRVPGAASIETLWDNLINGRESITRFDVDQLIAAGEDADRVRDPHYVSAYGALDNADHFDAAFFDIHRPEAEILDPQQRVFLECAWEVFERAGYDPSRLDTPVGVYAGAGLNSYALHHLYSRPDVVAERGAFPLLISSDKDFLPTRVSYKLNLKGPSINVQSGCSTSLVAIDLACEALLRGDCGMALAGGVTIRFPQARGHVHEDGMIFSPDGHTRTFDANAAGMVTGSGAGVVLLKRLDEALADGDHVHAVIKGSAINNDGAAKVGYTSPSVEGQSRVIAEALERAGVEPRSIGYVEAHGTATPVGDPIEVAALSRAWRRTTAATQFCAIGSIKTNVGHLDAAAGVVGFIKTVLAVSNARIPASLNFESPNPALGLEQSPFFVNPAAIAWPSTPGPRRAAVSSFGIGGTNAHVILEQAPEPIGSGLSRPYHFLALSGRTPSALDTISDRLADALEAQPSLSLADVALTLLDGRGQFTHRRAVVAHDAREAIATLREPARSINGEAQRRDRPVVFMFPGYGAQYTGMARGLYDTEPVFREALDRAAAILKPHLGANLVDVIFDGDSAVLRQTPWAHPAIVAVEHGLVQLWGSWGVRPTALLGNSLGEYTAACVAGIFTLEDLLPLVADRARLIADAAPGAMLAVSWSEAEVAPHLSGSLSLAVCVTDSSSIVSGTRDDIDVFADRIAAAGADVRRVDADCAPHSAFMDDASKQLQARVAATRRSAPALPLLSNVTGTWMTAAQGTDPAYWAAHLRSTVRLSDCFDRLADDYRDACVLEVGPGRTMASPFTTQAARRSHAPVVVTSLRHPNERHSDSEFIRTSAARLWTAGARLDGRGMYAREHRRRVVLPTYPFERKRYSIEPGRGIGTPRNANPIALPTWERVPAIDGSAARRVQHAIVFEDSIGVGAAAARQLRDRGASVTVVSAGREYRESDERRTIRTDVREDYDRMLTSLSGRPDAVIHCWTIDPFDDERAALDAGFFSLIFLAQALTDAGVNECRIAVASSGIQRVIGNERITPSKATVSGPARVIAQELEGFAVVHVDREDGDPHHDRFARSVIAELHTAGDPVVAYRHGHRWVRRFSTAELPVGRAARLRTDATYVVTGGMTGIGLELAVAIAAEVRGAHLLLLGRNITDSRRRHALARLDPLGARVSFAIADVADRAMLERVLDAHNAIAPIRGIVHAAGIAGGGAISLKSRDAVAIEFAAKIDGTRHLCGWAHGRDLDFIALCSSTSAFTGGFGSVAYTAANAFLDATADAGINLPIVSLNWHRWQGLGMAIETERLHEQLTGAALSDGIQAAAGRSAFLRVLANPELNRVAISAVDLNVVERESRGFVARSDTPSAEAPKARPSRSSAGTAMQKALADVWCDVLRLDDVGIDDAFTSLGGDSLLAVRVVARIRASLGVALPIRALYEKPTIAMLAAYAETLKTDSAGAIVKVDRTSNMPVSAAQRRFYLLHALDQSGSTYNVIKAMRLSGQLDTDAFTHACRDLVERHEILRTSFTLFEGEPVQQIHSTAALAVRVADLSSTPDRVREARARDLINEDARQPFNLALSPLIRVTLIRFNDAEHIALFVLHHIVADGRSLEVLFEELATIYDARLSGAVPSLTPLIVQYADYSVFEQTSLTSLQLTNKIGWWKRQLSGAPALLSLPTDRERPPVQSFAGDAIMFAIPTAVTARLKSVALAHGASLFMTVTAGLAALLQRYSDQSDICIASAIENRPSRETEGLIGAFLNTIVLRVNCSGDPSFIELLSRVRATMLDAFDRQDAPFERVVDAVQPDRRIAASPLAKVMLSWLDAGRGFPSLPGLRATPFAIDHRTVKSDLDLEIYEAADQLHVAWFYSTALFDRESMQWMVDDFIALLESAADPEIRVSELAVRSRADRAPRMTLTSNSGTDVSVQAAPFGAPRTDLEHAVAAVWSSLLGRGEIGIHADLFSIGGHSLMAVRIAARLSEQLGIELPPAAVFKTPTIAGLAAAIEVSRAAQLDAILSDVESLSDDEAKAGLT
jgi:amino acid adenylation domain-containing protein/non-ribosomal peptide synthase protein (TIGR01720 family)